MSFTDIKYGNKVAATQERVETPAEHRTTLQHFEVTLYGLHASQKICDTAIREKMEVNISGV